MNTRILYAAHDDGRDLAVIDVTNPAFAVTVTDAELAAMAERHLLELARQAQMAPTIQAALQQSELGRALAAASTGFLGCLPTYLLKLGPENLGAWETNPIDRHIAASFPAFTLRVRVQDMARLLADGLAKMAATEPRRRMCMVNIAGGPASDSWNALVLLHTEQPKLLNGRDVAIAVLDLDEQGPAFGARAVAALCGRDAPLNGLNIRMKHFQYEWSDAGRLGQLLGELQVADAACAISSEGGLFEYGSDAEIVENLGVLHTCTAPDALVVGSVTRDGALMRSSQAVHRIPIRPRTMEAFRGLAEETGWRIEWIIERPLSYHVSLTKSR
jgi:hypothetical protein